jgi:hypothetical protein
MKEVVAVTNLARGSKDKGAHHVPEPQQCSCRDQLDISENSFHVVALDDRSAIVLRQKWLSLIG